MGLTIATWLIRRNIRFVHVVNAPDRSVNVRDHPVITCDRSVGSHVQVDIFNVHTVRSDVQLVIAYDQPVRVLVHLDMTRGRLDNTVGHMVILDVHPDKRRIQWI